MKRWLSDYRLVSLVLALLTLSYVCAARNDESDFGMFTVSELSKDNVVVGQPVVGSLWLYAPVNVELDYVKSLGEADYGSCDVRVASNTHEAHFVDRVSKNGMEYNRILVTQVALFPTDPGVFTVRFPDLKVGVVTERTYDPFWGFPRGVKSVPVNFTNIHNEKLKVKALPKNAPDDFAKAIGKFTIEAKLPPGDIVKGRECSLIYTVNGRGSLDDFKFPDLATIVPEGLEIKSVTPTEKCRIADGDLDYEIVYVVKFIPRVLGHIAIPMVSFTFYDVDSKSFKTAESESVEFDVIEPKVREVPTEPVFI